MVLVLGRLERLLFEVYYVGNLWPLWLIEKVAKSSLSIGLVTHRVKTICYPALRLTGFGMY